MLAKPRVAVKCVMRMQMQPSLDAPLSVEILLDKTSLLICFTLVEVRRDCSLWAAPLHASVRDQQLLRAIEIAWQCPSARMLDIDLSSCIYHHAEMISYRDCKFLHKKVLFHYRIAPHGYAPITILVAEGEY